MLVVQCGILVAVDVYYCGSVTANKIPTVSAISQILSAPTHPACAINLYVILMTPVSHAVPACASSKNMSSLSEAT